MKKTRPAIGSESLRIEDQRARQTLDADWNPIRPIPIEGVELKEIKNVVYNRGILTELFRQEWLDGDFAVRHVTHVSLLPGQTSQWHRHHEQRDIVFPIQGFIRIGLYDGREDSPTKGGSSVIMFHPSRPRLLYIPPGVWHSLRNAGGGDGAYIVMNDTVFDYENPDDWVLPPNSPEIPVSLD